MDTLSNRANAEKIDGNLATKRLPSLIPGAPLLGSYLDWGRDPLDFLRQACAKYPDAFRFRIGFNENTFLANPLLADRVLRVSARNFIKADSYIKIGPLIGNGLLLSEGEIWKKQRLLVQNAFLEPTIAKSSDLIVNICQRFVDRLEIICRNKEVVDINSVWSNFTLEVINRMIFGGDISDEDCKTVYDSLSTVLPIIYRRIFSIFLLPDWVPYPENLRFKQAISRIDQLLNPMIERTRQALDLGSETLVSRLMGKGSAANDQKMDDKQVRDELMTLFLAGHETTATSLTWFTKLLTEVPGLDGMIFEAVREYSDFNAENDVLESAIYECLRLFPPLWATGREPKEDTWAGDYFLPKGTQCFVSQFFVQRHPEFWQNPDEFDISRFMSSASRKNFNPAYIPFASGLRSCIGKHLALLEFRVALTMILRRFSFEKVSDAPVELDPGLILKPKNPLLVRIIPRKA